MDLDPVSIVLQVGAVALAAAAAFALDRGMEKRRLLPPGFREPWRRGLAAALVATILWIGVFFPMTTIGSAEPVDTSQLSSVGLFILHVLLLLVLAAWYLLGFGVGRAPGETARTFARQFGLVARRPGEEVALGALAGVAGWVGVLVVMLTVVGVYTALFGQETLPSEASEVIVWIAGLPLVLRLAVSVSAGVVEELFFRGFLQPRVGVGLSTALFVLAHAGYEQPFMLVALTFLSLVMAALVRWRQNIWPAVVAHAVFDMVQLLVIIPLILQYFPGATGS